MIMALSGVKFSGKDTVAEGLIRYHKFKRIGLADKLKDVCSIVFRINRGDMDNPSLKELDFENPLELTETHILDLVSVLKDDGFDVDMDTVLFLYKNFAGEKLTSIRHLLQVVGTDICRGHIKDDIWLEYIKNSIRSCSDNIVITDARFKNERDFLREMGAVICLVKRKGFENGGSHISENQLGSDSDYDLIINNNGSILSIQSEISMWYSVMKDAITSGRNTRK